MLVSLAGPAFGLVAAIPFFAVWAVTGDPVWLQGAWFVALINLLNLAPAPPLDGSKALGPVLARIHPLLEKAALLGVGVLIVRGALSAAPTSSPSSWRSACSATCGAAPGGPTPPRSAGRQAGASLGLFVVTGAACAAVGLTAMALYTGEGLSAALTTSGRFLGLAS